MKRDHQTRLRKQPALAQGPRGKPPCQVQSWARLGGWAGRPGPAADAQAPGLNPQGPREAEDAPGLPLIPHKLIFTQLKGFRKMRL